jgi:hypothetical protein
MKNIRTWLVLGTMLLGVTVALAQPQPPIRIRGTITAFDGNELQVKSREGQDVTLHMADTTKVNLLAPIHLSDIKEGSFVGVTALQNGPGNSLQALEVHVFPEALRGTGEGHYAWDLEPGSSMTNANVDAIVNVNNGKELVLSYKGGSQKIIVPQGVPLVTFVASDRSQLIPGAKVLVITRREENGDLTALRISVGKDGMKPPM